MQTEGIANDSTTHTNANPDTATPASNTTAESLGTAMRFSPQLVSAGAGNNASAQAYHKVKLDQERDFWGKYVNQADAFDKQLVKTLSVDLENLLIFVSFLVVTSTHISISKPKGRSLLCCQYSVHC